MEHEAAMEVKQVVVLVCVTHIVVVEGVVPEFVLVIQKSIVLLTDLGMGIIGIEAQSPIVES